MSDYSRQKGFDDYMKDQRCLVYRTVRGALRWAADYGELEDPKQWAEDYIAGYTQAYNEETRSIKRREMAQHGR